MYKLIALFCVLAISGANAVPSRSISSSLRSRSTKLGDVFGIVEGVVSCGGAGEITEVRFTDCTRVPCGTVVGRIYTLEIDFIPENSHHELRLVVTILRSGTPHVILDEVVPGSEVEAGGLYTLTYNIPISGDFMGFSDLKVEVVGGDITELCAFASVNVQNP